MRGNLQKHKSKKSSIITLASVLDLVTTCPKCGGEIGLWSENTETRCIFCHYWVYEKERTIH